MTHSVEVKLSRGRMVEIMTAWSYALPPDKFAELYQAAGAILKAHLESGDELNEVAQRIKGDLELTRTELAFGLPVTGGERGEA